MDQISFISSTGMMKCLYLKLASYKSIFRYFEYHQHSYLSYASIAVAFDGGTKGLLLTSLNTLRPTQNGRHFSDDIFKCIFFNENVSIVIKISRKFVPNVLVNHIPILALIVAWHRPGDKQLYEPMMVSWLTHICPTRPHWVNSIPHKMWD